MAFKFFGSPPSFYDFSRPRQGLALPQRPTAEDLLDPLSYPDYPEAPERLTRGRDLDKGDRRALTMQIIANLAQAFASSGTRTNRWGTPQSLGGALAEAASANLGAEQEALARANEMRRSDYERKRQDAERRASAQEQRAKRANERSQIESMLAVGDKAIEAAGGADADPAFATKVFSLMRERNASALNAALDEAHHRRLMREKYKLDPEDPMALEAYKRKQELQGKVEEFNALDPLKDADELADYEAKKQIDQRYPTPREPDRARMWFDPTSGQIINLDAGTASAPIGGYEPRPRSGQQFDDVEKEAMNAADKAQADYDRSPYKPRYQSKNPRMPGYTTDPRLLGKDVPFDWEASYRAAERTRRKIANEKAAQADPSTGGRGAPPVVSPTATGVQSPKGAPVGMGGGLVNPAEVKRRAEIERKVAAVAAKVGAMSDEQKKMLRKKAATMTVEQMVAEIMRRRGGG